MEKNVFDQLAKRYDTQERIDLAHVIIDEVRKELKDSKSKSLLDYGSGTGLISLGITDLVDSVLLVDSSEEMVDIAKNKISRRGITNAKAYRADLMKDSPHFQTDIVLVSLVLLHIPDTKAILQALYNVMNEGGELLIIDFDRNENVSHPKIHNGFLHDSLKESLSEVGFETEEMKTFHHGSNIFMKKDASMFISRSIKRG